jgi:hypothetical protein
MMAGFVAAILGKAGSRRGGQVVRRTDLALAALTLVGAAALGPAANGQQGGQQVVTVTPLAVPRGTDSRAYVGELGWQGIETELVYVDQADGPLPMDGAPRYQPPRPAPERRSAETDWRFALALGLFLAAAAALFWKFGNVGTLLRRGPGDRRPPAEQDRVAGTAARRGQDAAGPDPAFLSRLRAMADRQAALLLLVERLLSDAVRQNGLGRTRSETARMTLRRLPPHWPGLNDLRRVVMTGELVQYGGRPLADDEFEQCLRLAAPILGRPA